MKRPSQFASWILVTIVAAAPSAWAATDLFQSPSTGGSEIRHGFAVDHAGDVNGDGIGDFIAGAPFDNALGAEAGRAFVWFGGSSMSDRPDVVLDDGSAGDWFGFSVAGIGDVDDDGYDDVAVGAPGDDPSGEKSGAVYVYLGGPSFSGSSEPIFAGEVGGDRFGWSVSAAGDLDDDGIDDFVVGAPYSDATGTDRGRVYVFRGSRASSLPTTAAATWDGPALGGPIATGDFADFAPDAEPIGGPGFGWSLADVPNFRGDGRDAVAVGAPGAAGASGRVHLFVGASALPSTPTVVFGNATSDQQFGWSVSRGGLISGDARQDLLVGAPGADGDRGLVKVFYGSSSPPSTDDVADLVRTGQTAGDRFGFAVAAAGDHRGSPGSWVAGAPGRDDSGLDAGWIHLFDGTGPIPEDVLPANRSSLGVAGDRWGWSLSDHVDVDGDGADDFLVGAPDANVENGAVRGLVGIVSSSFGVVAADGVRMRVVDAVSTVTTLDFESRSLQRASSVTLAAGTRVLARLGSGIERTEAGVRATFGRSEGTDTVVLTWEDGGLDRSRSFRLPSRSDVSLRLDVVRGGAGHEVRLRADADAPWHLRLIDVRGRVVRTLARGDGPVAERRVVLDGRDAAGRGTAHGVYFVVLEQDSRRRTARIVRTP
ncbi:MAG TPA: hypothetical protein VKA86_19000 [Candidatus Krumholzibacteria bacterium]|nr:hypothetical protein [Candidatus Krumholzibacteria bacterium]